MAKHRLLISALVVCSAFLICSQTQTPASGSAADPSKETFITWATSSQDYALFVPANRSGKPLSVVMYLHGAGNYPGPTYRSFWIIDALNKVEPCAVFLPHHPYNEADQGAGWGGTYDADFRGSLKEALAELDGKIAQYRLDADRQYAYGESMGGEAIYQLAAKLPARFAGLMPIAGYTEIKNAQEMAKTPIWMVYSAGDMDWDVAGSSRNIYKAILAAGGAQVKFTEYDSGATGMAAHMYAINAARGDTKFLSWLLSQRKRR